MEWILKKNGFSIRMDWDFELYNFKNFNWKNDFDFEYWNELENWSPFTTSRSFLLLRWCGGGIWKILKDGKASWKRVEISKISALKSLRRVGGCIYDYNVSLSPNLWLMTFNLELDLDLGLTISIIFLHISFDTNHR